MAINRIKKITTSLLLFIAAGFLCLTALVVIDPIPGIDRAFSAEIQEHSNPVLDNVMRAISWAGYMPNSAIVIGGTALLFLLAGYRREAVFTLATALSGLVSTVVKMAVNRPRPLATMVRIIEKTQQQSFPSGHVMFYTIFFGFVALVMFRLQKTSRLLRISIISLCLIMIFSSPLSRIYLGAHWFTDVTAGFLLGLLCLAGLAYLYMKPVKSKLKNAED